MGHCSEELLHVNVSSTTFPRETKSKKSMKDSSMKGGARKGEGNEIKGNAMITSNAALRRKKWINHEITRVANTHNINALLNTIKSFLPEMNGVNLATALHRVSKLVAHQGQAEIWHATENQVFQELHAKVVEHVQSLVSPSACGSRPSGDEKKEGHMKMYGLSVSSWSFAALRKPDPILFDAISQAALPNLHEFKPFELANLVWGFTKLGHGSELFFNTIAEHVCQRQMGTFGLQDICMVAWSFATRHDRRLNGITHQLFSSIATEVSANCDKATPQEIAMTFWSFAKIGYKDTALFMGLASTVLWRQLLGNFKPQEMSNTAWAFATAGIKHDELFFELARFSLQKRNSMVPQNVANILWSFAKLQVHGPETLQLFKALLPKAQDRIDQFKQCELTATFWAATKIQCNPTEFYSFFVMVAQYFQTRKGEITPRAMVSLLVSSSTEPKLGFFFDLLAAETVKHMKNFDPTTLCCLLRGHTSAYQKSLGRMSPLRQDALHRVMSHIERRIDEMNRYHMVHIITCLQQLNSENCDGLCDAIQRLVLSQWQQLSLTNFRLVVLGLSKTGCKIRPDFQQKCLQSGRLTRAFGPNTRVFESPKYMDRGTSLDTSQEMFGIQEPAKMPEHVTLAPPSRFEGLEVGIEYCNSPSTQSAKLSSPDNLSLQSSSDFSFLFLDDFGGISGNTEDSGDVQEHSSPRSNGSSGHDSLLESGFFFSPPGLTDPSWGFDPVANLDSQAAQTPTSAKAYAYEAWAQGRDSIRVRKPKYMGHSEDSRDVQRSSPGSNGGGGHESLFQSGFFFSPDSWSTQTPTSAEAQGLEPVCLPEPKHVGHPVQRGPSPWRVPAPAWSSPDAFGQLTITDDPVKVEFQW